MCRSAEISTTLINPAEILWNQECTHDILFCSIPPTFCAWSFINLCPANFGKHENAAKVLKRDTFGQKKNLPASSYEAVHGYEKWPELKLQRTEEEGRKKKKQKWREKETKFTVEISRSAASFALLCLKTFRNKGSKRVPPEWPRYHLRLKNPFRRKTLSMIVESKIHNMNLRRIIG